MNALNQRHAALLRRTRTAVMSVFFLGSSFAAVTSYGNDHPTSSTSSEHQADTSQIAGDATTKTFRFTIDAFIAERDLSSMRGENLVPSQNRMRDRIAIDGDIPDHREKFNLAGKRADAISLRNLSGNSVYASLEALDKPGNTNAYRLALENALESHRGDNKNPLLGYINVNLGSLALKKGDFQKAQSHFAPVAYGEVPAAANHRLMGLRRYAWSTHQLGDRVTAYQAYRAIEAFTDSDASKLTAQVEILGLLLEFAESGKGSHEEARKAMREFLEMTSDENVKSKAIVELMYLETYGRQPEPDEIKSIELAKEFLEKYPLDKFPQLTREVATASYQIGLCYYDLRENELAEEWFHNTINNYPRNYVYFRGRHPHAQSLFGLRLLSAMKQDFESMIKYTEDMVYWYPNEEVTVKFLKNREKFYSERSY